VVANRRKPRPMTPQQIHNRVQKEADARFGETIERLLFLLQLEHDREERIDVRISNIRNLYIKTFLALGDDLGGF